MIEKYIELDIPILEHAGKLSFMLEPQHFIYDGTHFIKVAKEYPEAVVIHVYITGGGAWQSSLKAIADCPNIFTDMSGSVYDEGIIENIVFSSLTPFQYIDTQLVKLAYVKLDEGEKDEMTLIFYIAPQVGEFYGLVDEIGLPRLEKKLAEFPDLIFIEYSQLFWTEVGSGVIEQERNDCPKGNIARAGRVSG